MNLVLLSGGSGRRLWPLSNDVRSKQFLPLLQKENGEYESMVQRIFRQMKQANPEVTVTVATGKTQVPAIVNQLGEDVGICIEPCRRDTFPAIVLAVSYLSDVRHIDPAQAVVVCPVDPYVDASYFTALQSMAELAESGAANLVLMGIAPTYPAEKFGYIIPEDGKEVSRVVAFKEKPTAAVAEQYIARGALWNGGVFAFRLGYLLQKAHELIDFTDYADLLAKYESLNKISFDYAVVEKEPDIAVQRYVGAWEDLGTWNALADKMGSAVFGKGMIHESCRDVNIINELDVPVLAMGLQHTVIAASPEGILVSDKEKSAEIKPIVDAFDPQILSADTLWGCYRVLDQTGETQTRKLTVYPGRSFEACGGESGGIWVVLSGSGSTVDDGKEKSIRLGEVVRLRAGEKKVILAQTRLQLMEHRLGENDAE